MPTMNHAAPPLACAVRRSRWLASIVAVAAVGGMLLLLVVAVPPALRLGAIAAVSVVLHRIHRNHFGERRIVRVIWDEQDQWRLALAEGSEWEVQLMGDSFIAPELMILNFRAERARFHLVVLPGVLAPEAARRLRARLRLRRSRRGERRAPVPGRGDPD